MIYFFILPYFYEILIVLIGQIILAFHPGNSEKSFHLDWEVPFSTISFSMLFL